MAAQPQPISKLAPTAIAPNGHLLPLVEVPTPAPSPSPCQNSSYGAPPPPPLYPNKNKDLPPTPPSMIPSPSPLPAMIPTTTTINPYETDLSRVPADDPFRDLPHYGRYAPSPTDDFQPDAAHVMSQTPASIRYWEDVLRTRCNADTLMLSPVDASSSEEGGNTDSAAASSAVALGRWIFAVGGCIVKTNHLAPLSRKRRDYSLVDANEVAAIALVRKTVMEAGKADGVRVPRVYFAGKLLGGDVLVQERLPGVSLEVAWGYLDGAAKRALRRQARRFAKTLAECVVNDDWRVRGEKGKRSYVVDSYSAIWARALTPRERKLMLPPPPSSVVQKPKSFVGARAGIGWGKRKDSGFDEEEDTVSSNAPGSRPRFGNRKGGNVFFDDEDDDNNNNEQHYSLDSPDSDFRFAHNDLSTSNIIVDRIDGQDRIVGVVDWEHAGWIGWRTTAAVHRELRAPLPEMYDKSEFESEEEWNDFFMWKGLYDSDSDDEREVGEY
ncbi:hypothetical protein DBV05_g5544 [Lasiodiplodia theobromae]|uniref:Aminoglycoside phosphotransferase domain-containing protein n=1 Tax=Lasiodiplodia theobromae TaxID=45133 RepID=A0A5N5DDN3_9PEZI|nr:hypothetical protein DBV05_g5544 [Lasiodiplodia theobromae]